MQIEELETVIKLCRDEIKVKGDADENEDGHRDEHANINRKKDDSNMCFSSIDLIEETWINNNKSLGVLTKEKASAMKYQEENIRYTKKELEYVYY